MEQLPKLADTFEDAVVVGPNGRAAGTWFAIVARVVAAIVIILPLLLGGKEDWVFNGLKLIVFAALLAHYAGALPAFAFRESAAGDRLKKIYLLALGVAAIQLVPLPLSVLGVFSPRIADLYSHAGAGYGFFTVEWYSTVSAMSWLAAVGVFALACIYAPSGAQTSPFSEERISSRHKSVPVRLSALDGSNRDDYHQLLELAIIVSGTLCALLALAHWATNNAAFLGLFGSERALSTRRAHWPFVNPNHLSVLLQMAMMLCASRLLTLLYYARLQVERLLASGYSRAYQKKRLLAVVLLSLSMSVLLLGNFLTVSRMGNVLALGGLGILWFVYERGTRSLRLEKVAVRLTPLRRAVERMRVPAMIILCGLSLLFFIGQKGREIATERLEHGLAANYDEVREILWTSTLEVIRDHPLFGVGFGCWGLGALRYAPSELGGWTLDYAHNEYLQFIAELGLGGALVLGLTLIWMIRVVGRALEPNAGLAVRLLRWGYVLALGLPLLHASVDFPFHIPALIVPEVLLLAMLVREVERRAV